MSESLGEDMYDAHKAGDAMPEAVELDDNDSYKINEMKELILQMTSYKPAERPSARDVYHQTSALFKKKSRRVRMVSRW